MRASIVSRVLCAGVLVVAVGLGAAACSAPAREGGAPGAGAGGTPTSPVVPRGSSPAPGITRGAGGVATAFGWVMRSDLEGGFWALVDRPPTESRSGQPRVIVVLLPGLAGEDAIARLQGAYAEAEGTIAEGASVRMAGPEMKVDRIAGAVDYAP